MPTTMDVFGMVHATVFATSMVRENVGGVVTNWYAAVPVGIRVTGFVLGVIDVVVTEIVFAALSPADHERDAGLYVTPVTGVGVSVMTQPPVGAVLGVTVTTCAAPPLMTTMDAVTVHVPRGRTPVDGSHKLATNDAVSNLTSFVSLGVHIAATRFVAATVVGFRVNTT